MIVSFSNYQQLILLKKLVKKLTEEDDGLTLKDEIEEYETKDKDKISVAEDTKPGATIKSENKGAGYNEQKSSSQDKQKSAAKMDRTAQSGQVSQDTVDVQKASFPDFNEPASQPLPQNIELVKDVPLKATVRLGKAQMKIKDILDLGEGSIIELDKLAGETVDLLVNGKLIAKGEVVVIDENFGFRVKDIVSPKERLSSI